jgi:hypothetical protein
MATFAWQLQGTSPTTIGATDVLRFSGGAFATPIQATEYNDSTHVRNSGGSETSGSNTPNNVKFISQSGGTGGDSQADWGDGTEDLDAITQSESTLKITFSDDASVETQDAIFYTYNGTTPATAAVGVDVQAAELGDTNWTEAEGSGAALALDDNSTPATSHDFYINLSMSPATAGLKSGALRVELTYT